MRCASILDRFDECWIVHEHERLQWRVGDRPAHGALLTIGRIEGGERGGRSRALPNVYMLRR